MNPIYKLLFLSSLWVSIETLFEASRVNTISNNFLVDLKVFQDVPNQPTYTTTTIITTTVEHNFETAPNLNEQSKSDSNDVAEAPGSDSIDGGTEEEPVPVIEIEEETEEETTNNAKKQRRPELFRNCTSPEASVPWTFHQEDEELEKPVSVSPLTSSVLNPHLKCGLGLGLGHSWNNTISSDGTKVRFIEYFEKTVKQQLIQPILDQEGCNDLVVFGAAFGSEYVQYLRNELVDTDDAPDDSEWVVNPGDLIEKHGRCFFMFVNHPENMEGKTVKPWKLGHYWLIPLQPKNMPYKNARRNTKLLKYTGQYVFLNHDDDDGSSIETKPVSPSVIIWQDAKFFRGGFIHSVPRDYKTILREESSGDFDADLNSNLPCLTTMALPSTKSTFGRALTDDVSLGLSVSSYNRPQYKDHCQTIIDALRARPGVTDSPSTLISQCESYLEFVFDDEQIEELRQHNKNHTYQRKKEEDNVGEEETDYLNFGLIDSAFLVWNESTQQCRDFNAVLRCTMLDQLQCHSDRDQVLFPLVIHQMLASSNVDTDADAIASDDSLYALKATYYNSWTETKSIVDNNWKPHAHDLDLVDSNAMIPSSIDGIHDGEQEQVYIRMKRSACHWYYFDSAPNQPMGERLCGHKIWMNDSLKSRNPSLEQEIQLAIWSSDPNKVTVSANATSSSLAAERGNSDRIDAPFAADFHKCTSPEYGRFPWTFREEGEESAESTCGTGSGKLSPFHHKLQQTVLDPKIRHLANEEKCFDMVVFGQALSEKDLTRLLSTLDGENGPESVDQAEKYKERRSEMQSNHGNCFFLFVVEQNLPSKWKAANSNSTTSPLLRGADNQAVAIHAVSAAGHYWLIPVDREILPYESMKRNSNIFQYNGQFFFPNAKSVIYQDITFFSPLYLNRQPTNYSELYQPSKDRGKELEPCLTVFALPKNKVTVGKKNIERNEEFFQGQCKHQINRMEKLAADSAINGVYVDPAGIPSLIQQCDAYLQFVYKRELDTEILNQGMVDTTFMSWNEGTEFCRDFNAQLRCTILDQMHCHSEHDRSVFPFALYVNQMGLGSTTAYTTTGDDGRWPVDTWYDQKEHDLNFFRTIPEVPEYQDVVRIKGAKFHWARKNKK
jgi:hypothetical protein